MPDSFLNAWRMITSLQWMDRYLRPIENHPEEVPDRKTCQPVNEQSDQSVSTCSCHQTVTAVVVPPTGTIAKVKKTARSVPSVLLSVLVAFFPKCPLCWAAYMSMFGSFGLAQTPYQGWLFPVLVGFLGLHLYLVFRKIPQKGYGPFLLSITGAAVLLLSRSFWPASDALLIVGMLFILSGSLWNSFSFSRLSPALAQ